MDPQHELLELITRRNLLARAGAGLGTAAFGSLLGGIEHEGPHFAPRAKRAIWLFMAGAPSQIDLLDYKPALAKLFDRDLPESVRKGQRLTTMTSGQKRFPLAPSVYRFTRHDNGGDGAWFSELLPHTARMAGDIAVVRSMYTEAIN
ncbi:MAG: DUF1501 domain-containing protein, partial [Planctomycetes bacterium]|nr:DUF1501 domain-containing protein [Planctomycetota bacterium]